MIEIDKTSLRAIKEMTAVLFIGTFVLSIIAILIVLDFAEIIHLRPHGHLLTAALIFPSALISFMQARLYYRNKTRVDVANINPHNKSDLAFKSIMVAALTFFTAMIALLILVLILGALGSDNPSGSDAFVRTGTKLIFWGASLGGIFAGLMNYRTGKHLS